MKLRIFGSGAVIYDAVDQIDPILVSSDFKSPNQTSQTRVLTQGDGGGPPRPRPGRPRGARLMASLAGAEPNPWRPASRRARPEGCVVCAAALPSVMSVTKVQRRVHTHTSPLSRDERAPKGGWRIQRCRAARDRLRRISAGERATRKG